MTDEFEGRGRTIQDRVAYLVAAYVSKNHVAPAALPALITRVQDAFAGLANRQPVVAAEPKATLTPAEIRKSITRDALISFIDGKPYKALRRHLRTHGLDPETYRQRYGLPVDYPMVAASYSEQRAAISRSLEFGRRRRALLSSVTSGRS